MQYTKILIILLLASFLSIPWFVAYGAGGRIEGKITDPKGEAITTATVTVTNQVTRQELTVMTDAEGRYKVESLPAGIYNVTVTAKGFTEGRRENVKIAEDSLASVDLSLEIAQVEAQVKVSTSGQTGNLDPVYQELRQQAKNDQAFAGDTPWSTTWRYNAMPPNLL